MAGKSLNYRRGRSGRPLIRVKAQVYATETHCVRCGQPVDLELPYRDPTTGKVNVWSKTIEHLNELDTESNPYDVHLAHLKCNVTEGAKYGAAKQAGKPKPGNSYRNNAW